MIRFFLKRKQRTAETFGYCNEVNEHRCKLRAHSLSSLQPLWQGHIIHKLNPVC